MKTLKVILALSFLSLVVNSTEAQHQNFNIKKELEVKKSSKEKVLTVEVLKDRKVMMLNVSCNVFHGSIGVEIYDPLGKKKGGFLVRNDVKKSKESRKLFVDIIKEFFSGVKKNSTTKNANGMMDKTFHFPQKGEWKIKIIPKKASGHVSISANQ